MADEIDAPVNRSQPSISNSPSDLVGRDPSGDELAAGNATPLSVR